MSALVKIVNGEAAPLTDLEIAAHRAEEAAWLAEQDAGAEAKRVSEIMVTLRELDLRKVRPLSDIAEGLGDVPSPVDGKTPRQRLAELNAEAADLRAQL